MTTIQQIITVLIVAVVTLFTRAIAFVAFPGGKQPPRFITWLSHLLPRATMVMLVIYCLKDTNFTAQPWGIPGLVGVAVTAALHVWKKSMVLSICGGTIIYMALLHLLGA